MKEIEAHLPLIVEKCARRKVSEKEVGFAIDTILSNITFIPDEFYKPFMKDATKLMKNIDEKDSPFIAVAMALDLAEASRVDGLLGLSFLRKFKICLDFREGLLEIQ